MTCEDSCSSAPFMLVAIKWDRHKDDMHVDSIDMLAVEAMHLLYDVLLPTMQNNYAGVTKRAPHPSSWETRQQSGQTRPPRRWT